jgi:hypothetical protein
MNRFYIVAIALLTNSLHAQTNLVPFGNSWKYLDDGSDQGTAWRGLGFNDASWAIGAAELGFGDSDENTVLTSGHITYYFRHTFNVPNPGLYNSIELDLLYDDGAVIYINGTEVDRVNMGSGTIDYQTIAASNSGDNSSHTNTISNVLQQGNNVISVELHNRSTGSSDVSFDLKVTGLTTTSNPATLERGPYLQMGTPTSMIVKWRTSNFVTGKVMFGTDSTNLNMNTSELSSTDNHEVQLTGLAPHTKYFYAIGSSTDTLFGYGDYSNFFYTSRYTGDKSPIRMWVLGDAGTANSNQRDVRDAYYTYTGSQYTDLVLQLGDNAYSDGKDSEYQDAMFENMYEDILRKTVFWSTIGNHDEHSVNLSSQTGPYFDIYSFPKNGEAGGLASGTEEYYSYNYGNVHFIVLSSENGDLTTNGTMLTWLNNDINNTLQDWIIAYWHHPPYSKGSHDSDVSSRETKMRENALPILEAAGVDMVLCGHSHSYERSYFINGHYSYSFNYDDNIHELDGSSGEHLVDCSYLKTTQGTQAGKGAVYAVAGSSGKTSSGSLNHPVMYMGVSDLGSMVIDVEDNRMDVRFLRENGNIDDYFTIMKDVEKVETKNLFTGQSTTLEASWIGDYQWPNGSTNKTLTYTAGNDTTIVVTDGNCLADTFHIIVTVAPVSIAENFKKDFKIYPLPAMQGENIFIEFGNSNLAKIRLTNQLGEQLEVNYRRTEDKINLETANIEAGIYSLSIIQGDQITSRNIIIR